MPKLPYCHITVAMIIRSLVKLRADERGGIAVIMGLIFPVLLAGLGIGFEISNWDT